MSNATGQDIQPPTGETTTTVEQPDAPDPEAVIQPDSASDTDSALGDDISVATASLTSSIVNYPYAHGRRYHAYRQGEYPLPNDEAEQARLDLHHHIFRLTLDGRLFRAPISANPGKVLDFGTGTGIWVMDFADEFPSAQVIGNDLSPIQPRWVPPNAKFYVDDVESDWVSDNQGGGDYDFVHGRAMAGSIKDWARLYHQAFRSLVPGGWIEMQEYETWLKSDDDPELARMPYLKQWQGEVNRASTIFGKSLDTARDQKQNLIDAGFVDVKDDVYKVPIGSWPRDPRLKELGRYQLPQVCSAIEPFSLGFLTRFLNWTEDECHVLVARVIQELRDRQNHLYVNFHFVYGRKPEQG